MLRDIYGHPLVTWDNLILLMVEIPLLYMAITFRIAMVFKSNRPLRRLASKRMKR